MIKLIKNDRIFLYLIKILFHPIFVIILPSVIFTILGIISNTFLMLALLSIPADLVLFLLTWDTCLGDALLEIKDWADKHLEKNFKADNNDV